MGRKFLLVTGDYIVTLSDPQAPDNLDNWQPLEPFRGAGALVEVVLGSLRTPIEAEQRELLVMWWRQRRLGHTLPPEPGLIVLDGGAK